MKFVRIEKDNESVYGLLEGEVVRVIEGDIFGEYSITDEKIPYQDAKVLAPIMPSKVVGMGINYYDFCEKNGIPAPTFPYIFLKAPSTICADGDDVRIKEGDTVSYEAEITIVIKDTCKDVPVSEAMNHVFGYTICNDMTDKTDLARDGHMGCTKNYDTFLPLGPFIETDYDWENKTIQCTVNDELKINGNSKNQIFPIPEQIAFISSIMTLNPGDIILSGSPAGASPVKPGDVMKISIEGLGSIKNKIVNR